MQEMSDPQALRRLESLSVVVPAYNAAAFAAETLACVRAYLGNNSVPHEILVVDDGSLDNTAAIVEAVGGVQLLRNGVNRGKGFSVRRGMLAARHAWVLFMDVDHSTRIENLERFAAYVEGADVVIASRRLGESRIVRRQHRIRQALGRTFPYFVRALALPDLNDTQCGFKLFRRDAARAIFSRQRVERFAFDVEALMLARRLGHRIAEVPVDWDNPTQSTLRVARDASRMMLDLLRTVWRLRGRRIPHALHE